MEIQGVETKSAPHFNYANDIDFYNNKFYIIDKKTVSICNLQLQILSSFSIPYVEENLHHLKVDDDLIYVTLSDHHQIFVYSSNGKVHNTIASSAESSKIGEFNNPRGLTIVKKILYICDEYNHRVQALFKNDYSFVRQWGRKGTNNGEFDYPYSITYSEDIIYIGDDCSIQLFTCEGNFVERIGGRESGSEEGQFWGICGLIVLKDRLYASDCRNMRIQIFKRK